MINIEMIGKQICVLRKEKNLSQEALAEILSVSPQAVSKWENGKALPETATLPLLAKALKCSIDSILMPQELHILYAVFTDGGNSVDVTQFLNGLIVGNKLEIPVNEQILRNTFTSDRLKYLIVKYQNPAGVFFDYTSNGSFLHLDVDSEGYAVTQGELKYLSASYGNEVSHMDVMAKLEHYRYFQWSGFDANHELFPSPPENDSDDYLTIVYLNGSGIHVASCAEGERLCFNQAKTELFRGESCDGNSIIENVRALGFEKGMDCSWAGALWAALECMGEKTTYETVMGVSGACWRIAFHNDCWDYSSADGLVAYDYAAPGYRAYGYEPVWAGRIDKKDRKAERENIIKSIRNGRPPIAINLRVAPEWGVITGYLEDGKRLLCRTYYDSELLECRFPTEKEKLDFEKEMKLTHGYLYVDGWPFLITYFSEKGDVPPASESFLNSLRIKLDSMLITENRGYKMGYTAYNIWKEELLDEGWYTAASDEDFARRLSVNHFCMLALVDARRSAAVYLRESADLFKDTARELVLNMADVYMEMSSKLMSYFPNVPGDKLIETVSPRKAWTRELRKDQADLLECISTLEHRGDELAKEILG